MKLVGLTGGIGSGKSTVATILENKGLPVYYADIRAKQLMNESDKIKSSLQRSYGEDIYVDNKLDKAKLSEIVFNDNEKLQALNALVHPEVFNDFESWKKEQTSEIIIKEAAILFEAGSYKDCDIVATVSAPEEIRIQRTIQRDHMTEEQVKARMSKQWNDEQRNAKADYIIHNDQGFKELERAVEQFYYWLNHNQ